MVSGARDGSSGERTPQALMTTGEAGMSPLSVGVFSICLTGDKSEYQVIRAEAQKSNQTN
jgi:hypothetical protein